VKLTAIAGGAMTSQPGYIPVQNSGGGIMNWTATAIYQNGSAWLTLDPDSGQNGGSVRVWAEPKGLSAGTYTASIFIDAGPAGSTSVPVTLTVSAAPVVPPTTTPQPPAISVTQVLNAATFERTPLVSGSLTTVMGSHLSGKNVAVTFDGKASTLLYTSDTQINLQVPDLGDKAAASLVVTVDGASSPAQTLTLAPAWPAVFSNGILNQDSTVNGKSAAAKRGDILQIFATGIPTGTIVSAQIAGHADLVPLYAGAAPTVPGVQQVNVAIPDDVDPASTQLILCATTGGKQFCSAGTPLFIQ
jgi:uncharacterized protein (TIGR03437 family)